MNEKPKIKTIESVETLLALFFQNINNQCSIGVLVRASTLADGRAELRFEAEHQKHILEIWPRLSPSRLLLQAKTTTGGKPVLLLSPHLPHALAADLRSAGINHA